MLQINYVSPNKLSYFLDKLKEVFATASELEDAVDNMELITVDDIDAICGTTIQNASSGASEVTF